MPRGIGTSTYLFVPPRVVFFYIKKVRVDLSTARCPRYFRKNLGHSHFLHPSLTGCCIKPSNIVSSSGMVHISTSAPVGCLTF